MEFIDLTSASEDERYQVKGILSNVSRNLEFTCGNKLTKSPKERITENGNPIADESNCNNKTIDQTSKSNYQSSIASTQTNSDQSSSSINNSSTSSNSSSNSLKMNGYHYNYYNHSTNNYHHPNNNLDADQHNSNSNHPQYNHYNNNHYQPHHNSHHPNTAHNSRMQPTVIPYSTHFISHNGLPPQADHSTAQYHKMPYYTAPHQFTPNTSSKPFYPTNPHFTPNTVLTSISPIVTSNQLHPHTNPEILNVQSTDLAVSNGQQRTNTSSNEQSPQQPIVHSSPYQVTYNPANGVTSNHPHHSFMHHHPAYIPPHPNAHHFTPQPMYFVPLHHPMTQFYTNPHYPPPPHMATAQPATILTPHQPLATPPISPQQDETSSISNNPNCDNDETIIDNQQEEEETENVNECKQESENNVQEDDEKDNDENKDQSTVSNYSFLSPESLEEDAEMNNKNDDDDELIANSNENEDQIELNQDNNGNNSLTGDLPANNDESSYSTIEITNTTNDDQEKELDDGKTNDDNRVDLVNELNVESINLNDDKRVDENKTEENEINDLRNDNENQNEDNLTETITETPTVDKEQQQEDTKPRSWADLFKSGKMDYSKPSKPSKIIIIDESSNSSNSLFNTTDSIVKLAARNPQQQIIKSVPVEEDDIFPKLSKKLKDLNLKHSLPLLIPRGFTNKSNWCYINAILQALLYCPPFYNLMREIAETPGIFREKSATPIIDSFAKFFTNFMPNEQLMRKVKNSNQFGYDDLPKLDAYEPICIYNVLGNINNECLKGKQEDAEEFLCAVLNSLHDEMLLLLNYDPKATGQYKQQQISKNNSSNITTNNSSNVEANRSAGQLNEDEKLNNQDNSKLAWKEVKTKHKTLTSSNSKNAESQITEIFGGTMLFIRKAGTDILHSRQPFFTLKLDIQSDKIHTVEDALRNLTLSESIHGYLCPKTNKAIEASYQTFLDQLPAILILHLKLHNDDNGQMKKSMKKLNFPIDLEMPKECLTQQDRSKYSKTYKLLAVVHHDGKDTAKGHYFTDIYHIGTSLWLRCDDSKVESISVQQLMHPKDSKIPYLLFYRRCDTLRGKNQNS